MFLHGHNQPITQESDDILKEKSDLDSNLFGYSAIEEVFDALRLSLIPWNGLKYRADLQSMSFFP